MPGKYDMLGVLDVHPPPAKATIKGGGCATLTTEGIGTAGRGAEHA